MKDNTTSWAGGGTINLRNLLFFTKNYLIGEESGLGQRALKMHGDADMSI